MPKKTRDVTYTIQITEYDLSLYPGITIYPRNSTQKQLPLARLTLTGTPYNGCLLAAFYIDFYPDGNVLGATKATPVSGGTMVEMNMNWSQLPIVLELLRKNPNCHAVYSAGVSNEINGIVTLKTKRK